MSKIQKNDWRMLKLLFEHFQHDYIEILCQNLEICGQSNRFRFGAIIDALSELRYVTQEFIDELQFNEMIEKMFEDVPEIREERNEKSPARTCMRNRATK